MSKAFLWDNLLEYVDGQSVIPIFGPELLVSRIDGRDVLVHRYVAERQRVRPEGVAWGRRADSRDHSQPNIRPAVVADLTLVGHLSSS